MSEPTPLELVRGLLCMVACVAVPLVALAGTLVAVVLFNRALSRSASESAERLRERLYRECRVLLELDDVQVRYAGHAFIAAGVSWYRGRVIVTERALYLLLRAPFGRHHHPSCSIAWSADAIPGFVSNYQLNGIEHGPDRVAVRVRRHIERGTYTITTPRAAELAQVLGAVVPPELWTPR